ncbi:hypothetical protein AAMO2058_001191400 [Amorphochlora amoebiformis]
MGVICSGAPYRRRNSSSRGCGWEQKPGRRHTAPSGVYANVKNPARVPRLVSLDDSATNLKVGANTRHMMDASYLSFPITPGSPYSPMDLKNLPSTGASLSKSGQQNPTINSTLTQFPKCLSKVSQLYVEDINEEKKRFHFMTIIIPSGWRKASLEKGDRSFGIEYEGNVITEVSAGSPAASCGIRVGMVFVNISHFCVNRETDTTKEIQNELLSALNSGKSFNLTLAFHWEEAERIFQPGLYTVIQPLKISATPKTNSTVETNALKLVPDYPKGSRLKIIETCVIHNAKRERGWIRGRVDLGETESGWVTLSSTDMKNPNVELAPEDLHERALAVARARERYKRFQKPVELMWWTFLAMNSKLQSKDKWAPIFEVIANRISRKARGPLVHNEYLEISISIYTKDHKLLAYTRTKADELEQDTKDNFGGYRSPVRLENVNNEWDIPETSDGSIPIPPLLRRLASERTLRDVIPHYSPEREDETNPNVCATENFKKASYAEIRVFNTRPRLVHQRSMARLGSSNMADKKIFKSQERAFDCLGAVRMNLEEILTQKELNKDIWVPIARKLRGQPREETFEVEVRIQFVSPDKRKDHKMKAQNFAVELVSEFRKRYNSPDLKRARSKLKAAERAVDAGRRLYVQRQLYIEDSTVARAFELLRRGSVWTGKKMWRESKTETYNMVVMKVTETQAIVRHSIGNISDVVILELEPLNRKDLKAAAEGRAAFSKQANSKPHKFKRMPTLKTTPEQRKSTRKARISTDSKGSYQGSSRRTSMDSAPDTPEEALEILMQWEKSKNSPSTEGRKHLLKRRSTELVIDEETITDSKKSFGSSEIISSTTPKADKIKTPKENTVGVRITDRSMVYEGVLDPKKGEIIGTWSGMQSHGTFYLQVINDDEKLASSILTTEEEKICVLPPIDKLARDSGLGPYLQKLRVSYTSEELIQGTTETWMEMIENTGMNEFEAARLWMEMGRYRDRFEIEAGERITQIYARQSPGSPQGESYIGQRSLHSSGNSMSQSHGSQS